jgi:uncharacterized membrane-anchored protein YhcB (DUF1043 family)
MSTEKTLKQIMERLDKLEQKVEQIEEKLEYHFAFYNGVWASRIQEMYTIYKLQNQTKEDLIKELQTEIKQFEQKYGGKFKDVFKDVTDPYELDEPDDYFDWRDALEELEELTSNKG